MINHTNKSKQLTRARRGATYVLVLAIAIVSASIAIGAIAISSAHRRTSELEKDYSNAGQMIESAMELAMAQTKNDPNWRTTWDGFQNGQYTEPVRLGRGGFRLSFVDPVDGKLGDNAGDPVKIMAHVRAGRSDRFFSLTAIQQGRPLDVLRTVIHANDDIQIIGDTIAGSGPISSNQQVYLSNGSLFGAIEASSTLDIANHVGSRLDAAPEKSMPSLELFEIYKTMATTIPFDSLTAGVISDTIAATTHPGTGGNNPEAIYLVVVSPNSTLLIKDCTLNATLLVQLVGNNSKLKIGPGVTWQPHHAELPSLIAYTENDTQNSVDIQSASSSTTGTSSGAGTTSSAGTADSGGATGPDAKVGTAANAKVGADQKAADPQDPAAGDAGSGNIMHGSLRGLFHVIRNVDNPQSKTTVTATEEFVGCIVADGKIDISGQSHLVADRALVSNPPLGYTTAVDLNNRLANGMASQGLKLWMPLGTNHNNDGPHLSIYERSGNDVFRISNRNNSADGITQDITRWIESGQTISGSFNVAMKDISDTVNVTIQWNSSLGGIETATTTALVSTTVSQVNFSLTPVWAGKLKNARFLINTANTTQDFFVDNLTVVDTRSVRPSNLVAIPTTWNVYPAN